MNIDLGVDALSPQLTGIGRYTLELIYGLRSHPSIHSLRAVYQGQEINDPSCLLRGDQPFPRYQRTRLYRNLTLARNWILPRHSLYHGPNFMLPSHIDGGIITVHDLSVCKYPETHPPERIAHFERDFGRSLERAWHVITDTETVKKELMEFANIPADRITAVHLGVSDAYRPERQNDGSVRYADYGIDSGGYILLVATFEPRKRIDAALKAFALLPEKVKKRFPLVLAGATGWRNEHLYEQLSQDEDKGYIRFLGYVPEEYLPGIYSGARLFLYPSIYEGFGLPPIEAMASGVPVIVSNRSCLPEVTGGGAMMIDPDDVEGFSSAIERGVEDDIWRQQAIQAGLEIATRYKWKYCIENIVGIYQKIWCQHIASGIRP
ncbi:MAG: glycosyltransferase family 1 protein [Sphingobium sp.]|nr:glycosyltransferase family 1 protein [Sphingobium sp.]